MFGSLLNIFSTQRNLRHSSLPSFNNNSQTWTQYYFNNFSNLGHHAPFTKTAGWGQMSSDEFRHYLHAANMLKCYEPLTLFTPNMLTI